MNKGDMALGIVVGFVSGIFATLGVLFVTAIMQNV